MLPPVVGIIVPVYVLLEFAVKTPEVRDIADRVAASMFQVPTIGSSEDDPPKRSEQPATKIAARSTMARNKNFPMIPPLNNIFWCD
jgi:hypothetical protein